MDTELIEAIEKSKSSHEWEIVNVPNSDEMYRLYFSIIEYAKEHNRYTITSEEEAMDDLDGSAAFYVAGYINEDEPEEKRLWMVGLRRTDLGIVWETY